MTSKNNKKVFFRNKIIDESNQEQNDTVTWRTKLHDLLLTSTSHGLPNALRTPHISMRVMWSLCFVASMGVCSYLIIKSVLAFFEYEVITKVRVVNEFQSEFPRILICNLNQFTTLKALEFLMDKQVKFSENLSLDKEEDLIERHKRAMQYASYAFNDIEKRELSFNLKDVMVSCKFSGVSCSWQDFEWIYNEHNGNCFVFNSGRTATGQSYPLKKLKDPGQFSALQIEMYVGVDAPILLEKFSPTGFTGVKLFIGNNTFKTVYEDQQEILVSSGSYTNIAVQRMLVNQREKPYSSCERLNTDSLFYRKIILLNYSYTRMDCHDMCKQKRIESSCKCYYPGLLRIDLNLPPCSDSDMKQVKCVEEVYIHVFDDEFNKECNQLCPLECDKMIFSTVYSQLNQMSVERARLYLINPLIGPKINATLSFYSNQSWYEVVTKSVVRFNVFYDSLSLLEVSEKPNFTFVDLISSMGGTFGLFLGISVLSVLELVEFVFEVILVTWNRRKIRQSNRIDPLN